MFEFKFTLDDNDYLAFNKYHLINSSSGKRSLFLFKCALPFICMTFVFIFWIAGSDLQLIIIESILMLIMSVLWIIFAKKMMFQSVKNNINKLKKNGRLPYSNEVTLTFNDEFMVEITPESEAKIKYTVIEKIVVAENAVYVYISSMQAHIIPNFAFPDEQYRIRFVEFVQRKIENYAVGDHI